MCIRTSNGWLVSAIELPTKPEPGPRQRRRLGERPVRRPMNSLLAGGQGHHWNILQQLIIIDYSSKIYEAIVKCMFIIH